MYKWDSILFDLHLCSNQKDTNAGKLKHLHRNRIIMLFEKFRN